MILKQLQNLTLGIEEEYQLIDPKTRELTSYITEILEDGSVIFRDEVKPELLQSHCNPTKIYNTVNNLLNKKQELEEQVRESQEIVKKFRTGKSAEIACSVIKNYL